MSPLRMVHTFSKGSRPEPFKKLNVIEFFPSLLCGFVILLKQSTVYQSFSFLTQLLC